MMVKEFGWNALAQGGFDDGVKYINCINVIKRYNDAMMHVSVNSFPYIQSDFKKTMENIDSFSSRAENAYKMAKDIEEKYNQEPRADLIKNIFDTTKESILESLK